jgi:hypothetical protein
MVENTVGKNEKERAVFIDATIEDTFVSFCTGKLFCHFRAVFRRSGKNFILFGGFLAAENSRLGGCPADEAILACRKSCDFFQCQVHC